MCSKKVERREGNGLGGKGIVIIILYDGSWNKSNSSCGQKHLAMIIHCKVSHCPEYGHNQLAAADMATKRGRGREMPPCYLFLPLWKEVENCQMNTFDLLYVATGFFWCRLYFLCRAGFSSFWFFQSHLFPSGFSLWSVGWHFANVFHVLFPCIFIIVKGLTLKTRLALPQHAQCTRCNHAYTHNSILHIQLQLPCWCLLCSIYIK